MQLCHIRLIHELSGFLIHYYSLHIQRLLPHFETFPSLPRSSVASHCSFKSTTESVAFYEYLTLNGIHKNLYLILPVFASSEQNFHPFRWWMEAARCLMCWGCCWCVCRTSVWKNKKKNQKSKSTCPPSPKAGTAHLHVSSFRWCMIRLLEVDAAEPFAQVGREKETEA